MKFENIHIIINPASGTEEPILSYLNKAFLDKNINWEVSVTTPGIDAYHIAEKLIGKTDLVAVYGGDGSVTEAAKALYGKDTPMAIIPGGTANVMAKELGIPQDSVSAIDLITNGHSQILEVDMGLANNCPFMIRVNFGIMADMILHTDREMKNKLGQLAYGITTIQTLANAAPFKYKMIIDGKEITEESVALTITNAGNIGISDFTFLPDISVTDGYLDVIILNNVDFISILKVAGTTLFQTDSEILRHIKCKEISIFMEQPLKYICDDSEKEANRIDIKVVPKALKVIVPIMTKV